MKNEAAFTLMLLACGGGVLLGRALPRDPSRDAGATPGRAPTVTFTPSRQPSCGADRAELEKTQAELARCVASTFRAPPVEPSAEPVAEPAEEPDEDTPEEYAARDAARMRRNVEVLKTHKEVIFVRRSDHSLWFYPPDQQIDDGLIVARRLPSGEIGWYDPDAGPRTDPSAFKPAPPGSTHAMPEIETGPDGLIRVNGAIADPAVQKMFGGAR
ncbi:hypothetical protein [Polyangium spumosum]|uniref:Uncharacterized protein n=1 Tax=Polyangium spumosum TaxID=889282 RepID=A0A6N7PTT2_9BACT|nr:hypothetical protein [Polyangium spumosum]MRG93665.1 hypothetical protein [Polyangium spumosum]